MTWRIGGKMAAACSCDLICPCSVDGTPTDPEGRGECRGSLVFQVDEGNLDGVDLSGVTFAFLNYFPSNLTAGNWRAGIMVDNAASDEQAGAVDRIMSGQEGGSFGDLAQFIGEYAGMQRGSVTLSDGDEPEGTVGELSEFRIEPLRDMEGTPTTIKNAMFGFAPEYTVGRASGRSNVFGKTYEPRYGEYCDFEFTSEETESVRARA